MALLYDLLAVVNHWNKILLFLFRLHLLKKWPTLVEVHFLINPEKSWFPRAVYAIPQYWLELWGSFLPSGGPPIS